VWLGRLRNFMSFIIQKIRQAFGIGNYAKEIERAINF